QVRSDSRLGASTNRCDLLVGICVADTAASRPGSYRTHCHKLENARIAVGHVRALSREETVNTDVILRRFELPDETRELTLGRFEVVHIGGMTIGRATYQPGWRWSEHV